MFDKLKILFTHVAEYLANLHNDGWARDWTIVQYSDGHQVYLSERRFGKYRNAENYLITDPHQEQNI